MTPVVVVTPFDVNPAVLDVGMSGHGWVASTHVAYATQNTTGRLLSSTVLTVDVQGGGQSTTCRKVMGGGA